MTVFTSCPCACHAVNLSKDSTGLCCKCKEYDPYEDVRELRSKLEAIQAKLVVGGMPLPGLICVPEEGYSEMVLQLKEVTEHRDRLRDMLNDVRKLAFNDQSLAVLILRRIDPVEDEVDENPKDAPLMICPAPVGCFGQCGKLLPCEDHPQKRPGICDICAGSMKLPSGADCPMCTEPHHGH